MAKELIATAGRFPRGVSPRRCATCKTPILYVQPVFAVELGIPAPARVYCAACDPVCNPGREK